VWLLHRVCGFFDLLYWYKKAGSALLQVFCSVCKWSCATTVPPATGRGAPSDVAILRRALFRGAPWRLRHTVVCVCSLAAAVRPAAAFSYSVPAGAQGAGGMSSPDTCKGGVPTLGTSCRAVHAHACMRPCIRTHILVPTHASHADTARTLTARAAARRRLHLVSEGEWRANCAA